MYVYMYYACIYGWVCIHSIDAYMYGCRKTCRYACMFSLVCCKANSLVCCEVNSDEYGGLFIVLPFYHLIVSGPHCPYMVGV